MDTETHAYMHIHAAASQNVKCAREESRNLLHNIIMHVFYHMNFGTTGNSTIFSYGIP